MNEESGWLLNGKQQLHFWQELERVERWLSTGTGAAVGRVYDSMGRPGEQTFAHYGNQLVAAGARVDRVREALDQSAPIAKRLVMQQLSGIGLSAVWDILIAACKEIALYYGGAVVTGAVVGGALGSLAFGVGAAPGAVLGTAAGSQVGLWVLALLGLKELAEGLGKMFPAAMEHYERGFREAWGALPENRRETWNSPALPTGNASAGAWQMAQGHVILVTAILTALVAYLTRGRGNKALLMQEIRQSPRLGPRFSDWLAENERRLIAQPQLQSRPNNSVAMAVEGSVSSSGGGASAARIPSKVNAVRANTADRVVMSSGGDRLLGSMGPARNSPELSNIESSLRANGVEIRYSTNEFAYGPASTPGRPGNIVFDPDASISSVRHEYGHFLDDQALGFPGQRFYYENPQFRVATERTQYLGELRTARELGDTNARRMLINDYLNERRYLIDNFYFTPDGTKIPYGGTYKR